LDLNTAGTELGSKLNKHMFAGKRKLSIIYEQDKRKSEKKTLLLTSITLNAACTRCFGSGGK